MKTVKCGIIGCGVIAPSHIESYRNLPGVEIKTLCDLVKSKAKQLAEKYSVPGVCVDYKDILNDPEIDCVSVCTDHGSHARVVTDALDAGKHVICEKALGASSDCLATMEVAHARNNHLVFTGIFQHRFEHVTRLIKEFIDRNAFGLLNTVNLNSALLRTHEYYRQDKWRGTWAEEGGSLLINQAIHYIDLINWLCGGVEEVSARFENLTHQDVIETEDTAVAIMKFKKGFIGSITATASSVETWRHTMVLSGTEGFVELHNDEVTYYNFSDKDVRQEFAERLSKCSEEKRINAGKTYYGEGHPAQIKDFIDAIREQRAPFVSAESARSTVEIVLACYESGRSGKWVKTGRD